MALSDIILYQRGGLNPVRLSASAIRVSWEINAFGALSCDLVTSELIAKGLPLELESYWISWEHPTAGRWGGVIADAGETSDGTYKIAAAGYGALMERRHCAGGLAGTTGSLLVRALSDIAASSPTYLSLGVIDATGPVMSTEPGLVMVVETLLPQMVQVSGYEWQITEDRVVNWLPRIGSEKSTTVRLSQGLHVATYQTAGSRPLIENFLFGTGRIPGLDTTGQPIESIVWSYVLEPVSIARHGQLEGIRDYGIIASPADINTALAIEIGRSANPARTATVTLVEVAGEWATFREGDTVRLALGDAAVEYAFRVRSRAIDVDQGVMELAGEAIRV